MPFVTVYNPLDRPVVIDEEGRTIGGGTWAIALTTAEPVRAGLEAGTLLEVKIGKDRAEPYNADARNARDRATWAEERRDALSKLDRDELAELARSHAVIDPDDPDPHKRDLVAMLAVRDEVEVDKPDKKPKTRRRSSSSSDTEED